MVALVTEGLLSYLSRLSGSAGPDHLYLHSIGKHSVLKQFLLEGDVYRIVVVICLWMAAYSAKEILYFCSEEKKTKYIYTHTCIT